MYRILDDSRAYPIEAVDVEIEHANKTGRLIRQYGFRPRVGFEANVARSTRLAETQVDFSPNLILLNVATREYRPVYYEGCFRINLACEDLLGM